MRKPKRQLTSMLIIASIAISAVPSAQAASPKPKPFNGILVWKHLKTLNMVSRAKFLKSPDHGEICNYKFSPNGPAQFARPGDKCFIEQNLRARDGGYIVMGVSPDDQIMREAVADYLIYEAQPLPQPRIGN